MGPRSCLHWMLHFTSQHPSLLLFRDPSHENLLQQERDRLLQLGAIETVPQQTSTRQRVLLLVFPNTQEERRLDIHIRPQNSQQIYESLKIQDGH